MENRSGVVMMKCFDNICGGEPRGVNRGGKQLYNK